MYSTRIMHKIKGVPERGRLFADMCTLKVFKVHIKMLNEIAGCSKISITIKLYEGEKGV